MSHVPLGLGELCLAALLIVINGAISVAFRLGLERTLFLAALRMVVQLAAVGYVLQLVFRQSSPWVTAGVALAMVAIAAFEVRARQASAPGGYWSAGLGGATLLVVGVLTTAFITAAVIGTEPWWSPRVYLPVLGMILGNALTGVALTLETLTQTARETRAGIEARLALGHSRYAAFEGCLGRALTTALMPMINAMSVAGVVSLPGMMTGQILSGVEPVEAAKYQIMILFAIAGSTGLAVLATALAGVRLLTDERARLRLDEVA